MWAELTRNRDVASAALLCVRHPRRHLPESRPLRRWHFLPRICIYPVDIFATPDHLSASNPGTSRSPLYCASSRLYCIFTFIGLAIDTNSGGVPREDHPRLVSAVQHSASQLRGKLRFLKRQRHIALESLGIHSQLMQLLPRLFEIL